MSNLRIIDIIYAFLSIVIFLFFGTDFNESFINLILLLGVFYLYGDLLWRLVFNSNFKININNDSKGKYTFYIFYFVLLPATTILFYLDASSSFLIDYWIRFSLLTIDLIVFLFNINLWNHLKENNNKVTTDKEISR